MKHLALCLALFATACGGGRGIVPGPVSSPYPPPAQTTFCMDLAPASPATTTGIAAIQAAGFDCIRTDYDPAQYSYAWVAPAIAAGMSFIFIGHAPTVLAGMALFPHQKWELDNEPDTEPGVTAASYVATWAPLVPQMRTADPTATIILGGVAGGTTTIGVGTIDYAWIQAVSALWPLVDYVGLHPYPPPWQQNPIASLPTILATVTAMTGKPAVITEWGAPQQYAPLLPTDPLQDPLSPTQAASAMAQMIQTVRGRTSIVVVYEWDNNDDPWAATEGFGLVGTPALAAASEVIQ